LTPPRPARVLFVAPSRGLSFVEHDLETLSRTCAVEVLSRRELASRRRLLPRVLALLAARRCDLVYVWFADPYDTWPIALLARLFGVPAVVVVGGYEMASLPAIGYGAMRGRRERRQVALALRLAHTVLPTSELLAAEIRGLVGERPMRVLAPAIDCEFFRPGEAAREPWRERLVVTVATIAEPTWRVKGLDAFAACARLLPDISFAILGPCEDEALAAELQRRAGGNLQLSGRRLTGAELREWYQRAAVYAQLSRRESFGVALAEAMACGCVPVATAAGALPAVVGDTGLLVACDQPVAAASAITHALALAAIPGSSPGAAARARIERCFGAGRRERELTALIAALTAPGRARRLAWARRPRRDDRRGSRQDDRTPTTAPGLDTAS
jgi:glycosyltransferase involved in cell wall biosynthesis